MSDHAQAQILTPMTLLKDVRDRNDLSIFWQNSYPLAEPAVEFYGHKRKKSGKNHACFSNFYLHDKVDFTVPDCCWDRFVQLCGEDVNSSCPRTISTNFSEKSIMLCKAAVMGDAEVYREIVASTKPHHAKGLGRRVRGFDEEVWQSVLCSVAFEAVYQKFKGLAMTKGDSPFQWRDEYGTLMKTGNALIVEVAPGDKIWGIGHPGGHPHCQDPREWRNGNVLGFALMKTRMILMDEQRVSETRSETYASTS